MATLIPGTLLHALAQFNNQGVSANRRNLQANIVRVNGTLAVLSDALMPVANGDVVTIGKHISFTIN